jgi:hypothetical protein
MIRKSMPPGLIRGWKPVLRKDHAQSKKIGWSLLQLG